MKNFNQWFESQNAMRQGILREDKWALANAAFEAGKQQVNAELLGVLQSFEISEPDSDGIVWLFIKGNKSRAMFNLGHKNDIAGKAVIEFWQSLKTVIPKATGKSQ